MMCAGADAGECFIFVVIVDDCWFGRSLVLPCLIHVSLDHGDGVRWIFAEKSWCEAGEVDQEPVFECLFQR